MCGALPPIHAIGDAKMRTQTCLSLGLAGMCNILSLFPFVTPQTLQYFMSHLQVLVSFVSFLHYIGLG
jgi:hypothetical protein